jgi:chaperonin cofactor prefoldin
MNINSLMKAEKLTLYVIEQEKKIKTESNEIEGLKKEIEILKKDTAVIKTLVERLSKMEGKLM